MDEERLISADSQTGDIRDRALRPLSFGDFVGQAAAIANLRVYVEAARRRGESLLVRLSQRQVILRRF